jgi:glycogen phosphorylase
MADEPKVGYFSMEMTLEAEMPTYSGGLGVLAGDMVYAAADLEVPMVAVTLLYRKGYFTKGSIRVVGRVKRRWIG